MMWLDQIDRYYSSIDEKSSILKRLRFYSAKRLVVRVLANVLIPAYYWITKDFCASKFVSLGAQGEGTVIVSLTSFPARINRVWIVIESLLRQSVKPKMIVLWLSREQFPALQSLPKSLLSQRKRGLDIRLVDGDLRSHKKYYHALLEYPNDFLILVDDDVFYPTKMIEELVNTSNRFPSSICCHRALRITQVQGVHSNYADWTELKSKSGPSSDIFFTSGGGTLIPPRSLHPLVLKADVFTRICPYADDVWLNAMCRLNGTDVVKTNFYSALLPVLHYKDHTLYEINVLCGQNDVQYRAVLGFIEETELAYRASGLLK
jgi:hypothetical protein